MLASGNAHETKRITSGGEKLLHHFGRSPSAPPFEPRMVPADDSPEREYTGNLEYYYDEVISCLRQASAILLFGPGEAKGELKKRIERDKLDLRINRLETADRMTELQITQKVRQHYFPPAVSKKTAWTIASPGRLVAG